jgi:hypothetical protein
VVALLGTDRGRTKRELVESAVRLSIPRDRAETRHEEDVDLESIEIVPRNEKAATCSIYWSGKTLADDNSFYVSVAGFGEMWIWFGTEEAASIYLGRLLRGISRGRVSIWSSVSRATHITRIDAIGSYRANVLLPLFLYRLLWGVRKHTFEGY